MGITHSCLQRIIVDSHGKGTSPALYDNAFIITCNSFTLRLLANVWLRFYITEAVISFEQIYEKPPGLDVTPDYR